jgi:hypothetical protein
MSVFRVPVSLEFPGTGSPGVNVWSVRTVSGTVAIDELDAALDALQVFYDSIRLLAPNGWKATIGPDIVERTTSEDHSQAPRVISSVSSGSFLPQANQIVVSWRTSLRARRGMGRTFIGPLRADQADVDGTPTAGAIGAVQSAANTLVSASLSNAFGWAVGVWGLQNPGSYDAQGRLIPGQPHVHRDTTSAKVKDQFAVLRSRRD